MDLKTLSHRSGSIDDLDELQKLAVISYSQFKTSLSPENWTTFNNFLHDKQKFIDILNVAKSFVCLDENKIIGVAYIIPRGNPTDLFKEEWSYIRMVGVDPDYRGKGIAKTLTQLCIDHAKQTKEKTIALHTSEFMDAARHIYESIGFKAQQEFSLFGKRYWLYTLELNGF
jgi:ribosomal protein S18 acetylase RimI-like enzyme